MKRFSKIAGVMVVILSILLVLSGCQTSGKGTLTMGTNAEFPPFEYIEHGEFAGIDVDLAAEIAKDLGMELKVENMAFDTLIDAVNSGKVDFVAAGMTVRPDREENVDFTLKYYNATQTIIVHKDNDTVETKEDLEGKKVGVQTGTTGQDIAGEIKDVDLSKYNNGLEAVMDLKNGKIDAVIIDNFPAQSYVEKNSDLKLVAGDFDEEQYAMAVKKGNKTLLDKMNKALNRIMDDGTYEKIMDKYSN